MRVSWDDDIPNIWENKKCSKPPTSTNQILFEFYVHIILQFSPVPCILTFLAVFGLKLVSVSTHAQKTGQKIRCSGCFCGLVALVTYAFQNDIADYLKSSTLRVSTEVYSYATVKYPQNIPKRYIYGISIGRSHQL